MELLTLLRFLFSFLASFFTVTLVFGYIEVIHMGKFHPSVKLISWAILFGVIYFITGF